MVRKILSLALAALLIFAVPVLASDMNWSKVTLAGPGGNQNNGLLIVYTKAANELIVGEYKMGKQDGIGLCYGVDESGSAWMYCGGYSEGMFHGHGVFYTTEGDRYEGNFLHDEFEGIVTRQAGESIYEMEFAEGAMVGEPIATGTGPRKEVKLLTTDTGGKIVGEFDAGSNTLNGWGAFVNATGEVWLGQFEQGTFVLDSGANAQVGVPDDDWWANLEVPEPTGETDGVRAILDALQSEADALTEQLDDTLQSLVGGE